MDLTYIGFQDMKKCITTHKYTVWRITSMQMQFNVTPKVTRPLARRIVMSCTEWSKNRDVISVLLFYDFLTTWGLLVLTSVYLLSGGFNLLHSNDEIIFCFQKSFLSLPWKVVGDKIFELRLSSSTFSSTRNTCFFLKERQLYSLFFS